MSSTDPANVEPGSLQKDGTTLDIEPAKPPDEDIVSIDHYEILRLGPQADEETIERVYRTLAGRFHSNGPGTDDAAVLLRIRKAYETLSNPDKRARYNVLRQRTRGSARFRDREFFDGVRGEQNRRLAILCLLYRQRVGESPGLTLLDLEQTTGCTREELGPALWYLCEKKLAKFGEGSDYRITAAGFDIVESKLEERDAAKLWAWLYPEDTGDNEFIYASARPTQPAAMSHQTVEVVPESPVSKTAANAATAPEKQNSQPVAELEQTDIEAGETPAPVERNLVALVRDEPAAGQAMDLVEDPAPAEGIAQGPVPIEDALGFTKQVATFADGADYSIIAAGFDLVASQHEERDATESWAWLYPEDTGGNEFVSPTERPNQLAAQSQQTVPVPVSNAAAAPEKQNLQPATEAAQAEIKAEEPPGAEAEVAEVFPVADSATPAQVEPAGSTLADLVRDESAAGLTIALVEDPAPAERTAQEPIPIEEAPGIAKPVVKSEESGESGVTAVDFEIVESNPVAIPAQPVPPPAESTLAAVRDEPTAGPAMAPVEDPAPAERTAQEPIPIEEASGIAKPVVKSEDDGDFGVTADGFEIVESGPVADPAQPEPPALAESTLADLVGDEPTAGVAIDLAEDPAPAERTAQAPIPIEDAPRPAKHYRRGFRDRREGLALSRRHRQQRIRKYEAETHATGREKRNSQPVTEIEQADIKAWESSGGEAEAAEIFPAAAPAQPGLPSPAESTLAALVHDEPAAGLAMDLVEDPAPAERVAQERIPIENAPDIAKQIAKSEDAGEPGVTAAAFEIVESKPAADPAKPEPPSPAESTLAALVHDEPAAGLAMDLVEDPAPTERVAQGPIPVEEDDAESGITAAGFEIVEWAWNDSEDNGNEFVFPKERPTQPAPVTPESPISNTDTVLEKQNPQPVSEEVAALVHDEPAAGLAMDRVEDPAPAERVAQEPIPVEEDDAEPGITANGFEIIERAWSDSEDSGNELVSPQERPTQPAPLMPESPVLNTDTASEKQNLQPVTEEVAALVHDEPAAGLAMDRVEDPAPAERVAQEPIPVEEDDDESSFTANGFEIIERAWSDSEDNGNEFVSPKDRPTQPAPLTPESPISNPDTAPEKQNPQPVTEVEQSDIRAEAPSGAEAEAGEVFPVAFPATPEPPVPVERTSAALVSDESAAAVAIPLVEGPAAAEQIAQGPIPVEEAPAVTKRVAVSLEAADEKRIVPGDLKPASIEIEPDGWVEEPDLGKEKPAEQAGLAFEPPAMPTVMETIPGTTRDMAPEDADGKGAGVRAHLRAFGIALREMPTAPRLFVSRTISARRAQAKEKRMLRARQREDLKPPLADHRRFQSASRRDQGKPAVTGRSRFEKRMQVAVVLLAVSTVAALFFHFYEQSLERSQRYRISTPGPAAAEYPALSPDGRHLAFVARKGGPSQLWVLALDTLESQVLPETSGASYPFWSPDSAYLGFFTQGKLKKIAIAGGPPLTLCDASGGRGGTWNRNDVILFSPGPAQPLFSVSASGGVPTRVTKLAPNGGSGVGHRFPVFLPDGLHFLYTAGSNKPDGSGVFVGSLDGAAAVRLLTGNTNALYAPPPKPGGTAELLFRREKTLLAQPFDASGLRIAGNVFPVAEEVQDGGNAGFGAFSVSENGILAFRSIGAAANGDQLARADQAGTGPDASPVSPGGKIATTEPITVVTNWYRSLSP